MKTPFSSIRACAALVFFAGSSSPLLRAGIVYDFDTDVIGKTTPFTDIVGGLAATFTSSGPTELSVSGPPSGNKDLVTSPHTPILPILTIQFSAAQTSISMDFGAMTEPGQPFNLDVFNGSTAVGTATAITVEHGPLGGVGGSINFTGPAFDRVVLTPPISIYGIDNVMVDAVPEPASLWLVAIGALGTLAKIRRQYF